VNPYEGLRNKLLTASADELGIPPSEELPDVWAALTDLGMEHGTATIATVADGSTSMYTSSGGGIIGAGMRPPIAEATREFLATMQRSLDRLPPAETAPLPPEGSVAFVALTRGGIRRVQIAIEGIDEEEDGPLYALWAGINGVITLMRLTSEAVDAEG